MSRLLLGVLAIATMVLIFAPATAQDLDTLKRIKTTETIVVGYRDVSSPFSYVNDKKEPIGYSIDICTKIIDAIRSTQQLPRLTVKWVLVTGASRIPMVANGTVDIECGSTTNTLERQQQVAFSVTTFVAATRLAYKKSEKVKSLADLKGKVVVAVAGTTNLRQINLVNVKRQLGMKIAPVKDNATAFAMVQRGEAAAFGTDDILLYDMIANSAAPGDYEISDDALSVEPYGIMMRKNDAGLKQLADDTLRGLFKSGEISKIYGKWFLSPIPPRNVVLNALMSETLKKVIAEPTDSALPSDYSADEFFKSN